MSFSVATPDEILHLLGQRLRTQRLTQKLTQHDLAQMAGLSLGAVRKLESSGHSSVETLVRAVQALGLVDEMDPLFIPGQRTIAQMEQVAAAHQRQRAPRRRTA